MSSSTTQPIQELFGQLNAGLRALILEYVERGAVSYSPTDNTPTDIHELPISLGGEQLLTNRLLDASLFVGFEMRSRRVVDLGCGLGEYSRLALASGAALVEGVDCEPYFVKLANLINNYDGLTNIYVREGDLSAPDLLSYNYDVMLFIGSLQFAEETFPSLASRADRLIIVGQDTARRGWSETCMGRAVRNAPFWQVFDKAALADRAIYVAFAKKPDDIAELALRRGLAAGGRANMVIDLDADASAKIATLCGRGGNKAAFADFRARLMEKPARTRGALERELQTLIAGVEIDENASRIETDYFGSDQYWKMLFVGLLDYFREAELTPENPYLVYLTRLSQAGRYDPELKADLEHEDRAQIRIARRLEAMAAILRGHPPSAPPLIMNLFDLEALEANGLAVSKPAENQYFQDVDGRRYWGGATDGHHRLAALYLAGNRTVRCAVAWSNVQPIELSVKDKAHAKDAARRNQAIFDALEMTLATAPVFG